VELRDYYLYNATSSTATPPTYCYNLPKGAGFYAASQEDFVVRFPLGARIEPGQWLTVAVRGNGYAARYGKKPDYYILEPSPGDPAKPMDEAAAGSVDRTSTNAGRLTNGREDLVLFSWDGFSDLVTDVDYMVWGNTNTTSSDCYCRAATDKSNVAVDGPDQGTEATAYLADTAIALQTPASTTQHDVGKSFQRVKFDEAGERLTGGNGVAGHDETSEPLGTNWVKDRAVSPGGPP
jgi:hypothetical protein